MRPDAGAENPLWQNSHVQGEMKVTGEEGPGLLGIPDPVHEGSAAQAGAPLNPTAPSCDVLRRCGCPLVLSPLCHRGWWPKAWTLEPACLGSNPRAAVGALRALADVINLCGLHFLTGEPVSLARRDFLRIKCMDTGKELRWRLACAKSSINISVICAQQPFQTSQRQAVGRQSQPAGEGIAVRPDEGAG